MKWQMPNRAAGLEPLAPITQAEPRSSGGCCLPTGPQGGFEVRGWAWLRSTSVSWGQPGVPRAGTLPGLGAEGCGSLARPSSPRSLLVAHLVADNSLPLAKAKAVTGPSLSLSCLKTDVAMGVFQARIWLKNFITWPIKLTSSAPKKWFYSRRTAKCEKWNKKICSQQMGMLVACGGVHEDGWQLAGGLWHPKSLNG